MASSVERRASASLVPETSPLHVELGITQKESECRRPANDEPGKVARKRSSSTWLTACIAGAQKEDKGVDTIDEGTKAAEYCPLEFTELGEDCLEHSILHRFKSIVETYGDRCAIDDVWSDKVGGVSWTYGYLGLRVAMLSNIIKQKELPKDRPIALFIDQGRHFILSMLAVMHAGHFWTPLDPASSSARASSSSTRFATSPRTSFREIFSKSPGTSITAATSR